MVLFIGMGKYSQHEAEAVRHVLPGTMPLVFCGTAKYNYATVTVAVGRQNVTYDLTKDEEITRFIRTAFVPTLNESQKALVQEALSACQTDARDELGLAMLQFHRAQTPGSGVRLEHFVMSGHSGGGDVWGDENGFFYMRELKLMCEAFPDAAAQVHTAFFACCNHLHADNVRELREFFPNLKQAGGYHAHAPGSFTGGIPQVEAWMELVGRGEKMITPDKLYERLNAYKSSATNTQNPDYYAHSEQLHLATWNERDGLYRFYEDIDSPKGPQTESLAPDPGIITSRAEHLANIQAVFTPYFSGTSPSAEMAQVSADDPTSIANQYYRAAQDFGGTVGLSEEQKRTAADAIELGLCARFYPRIIDQFCAHNATLLAAAAREGQLRGVKVLDAAGMHALTRAQMQVYIMGLLGQAPTGSQLAVLGAALDKNVWFLKDVPHTWL